jgi:hypothetical protein
MMLEKRNSLQQFTIEQILGPGVCNYRFIDLNDSQLLSKKILDLKPGDYNNEIINIVPAGVYSTGILFPIDRSKYNDEGVPPNYNDTEVAATEDEDDTETKDFDWTSVDDDSVQLDQMYPNIMGFTCCLDETINYDKLTIKVAGRYYKKIDRRNPDYNVNYGVLYEGDKGKLDEFILNSGLNDLIKHVTIDQNSILQSKFSSAQITEIKTLLRNVNETKAKEINHKISDYNYQFKTPNISALKQSCYYEIKNKCIDTKQRDRLYQILLELEEVENIISHINDLIDMCDSRSYGLWQSTPFEVNIPFPEKAPLYLKNKKIFSYRRCKSLEDIIKYDLGGATKASLSLNLQLNKDTRKANNKVFLKAQLINTSTYFDATEGSDSRYYSSFNEIVNQRAFFGVQLSITNDKLLPYNDYDLNENLKGKYSEDEVTRFIYRQFNDYCIGHGCSVKWIVNKDSSVTVKTEYIPESDTPDVESIPKSKNEIVYKNDNYENPNFLKTSKMLEFKWLSIFSETSNEEIISGLKDFINSYGKWIKIKIQKYAGVINTQKIAMQELEKCEIDKNRMMKNVEMFLNDKTDSRNVESFRLMNAAMFMQLWHSTKVKENEVVKLMNSETFTSFNAEFYRDQDLILNGIPISWRPFQMAFILLNLDGIFRPSDEIKWEKRNDLVDLVWFPTGGGKTEAYLGIIALTIINRRRYYGDIGGGTAAIMRYTLRLLTLQQFQRASLMIMAVELIRRWGNYNMGNEPIFIGLWVGNNSLPNRMSPWDGNDKDNLQSEFQKLSEDKKSRIPYEYCPWCRSKLSPSLVPENSIQNVFYHGRLFLRCSYSKCSFYYLRPSRANRDQGPLPVSLCDEEIYRHPPALLFGTVDKFAQLAHKVSNDPYKRNKDSRRIFGKGNWEEGKPKIGYLTPDLIIQDELHLLLGPLGSSVALFESAIDQLCTREDGTRPKIISSTATTRNTELQIMALFGRKVNLFPKPGIECDDSFFAFYKRIYLGPEEKEQKYISKRRYLGVMPTGRTHIWMQMRLAAILMTHRAIFELQELDDKSPLDFDYYKRFQKTIDYYHTVVSYFNSLKELGKTESQIYSYILKEIRRVFNRVLRPQKLMHSLYTYSIKKGELTGRMSGEEIKNEMEVVQSRWSASRRFAYQENHEIKSGHTPPDFVVATNMISVGIDIARFNCILMNSMPRNIAEYIQASSRIARESYGLVITIHHPFRSRDISHYEKFIEFHEKMYSYVEPISITPFTKKAVERYLGLYLATMLRHTTKFTDRNFAADITLLKEKEILQLVDHLSIYFDKRKSYLATSFVDDLVKNLIVEENVVFIKKWIAEAIFDWKEFCIKKESEGKNIVFNNKDKKKGSNQEQLYVAIEEYEENIHSSKWIIPMSLRVIEPEAALKIELK